MREIPIRSSRIAEPVLLLLLLIDHISRLILHLAILSYRKSCLELLHVRCIILIRIVMLLLKHGIDVRRRLTSRLLRLVHILKVKAILIFLLECRNLAGLTHWSISSRIASIYHVYQINFLFLWFLRDLSSWTDWRCDFFFLR